MKRLPACLLILSLCLSTLLSAEDRNEKTPPEMDLKEGVETAFQVHDYKKVIRLYREFAASKPDRYVPLSVKVFYSQSLADTGDIDGAIDSLKDVLADTRPELDPTQIQYDLATLYFLQKRYEEARGIYRRLLLQADRNADFIAKAKERLSVMKDSDGNAKKKDVASLEMIDLESALDAGEVPDGASTQLERIIRQNPNSSQAGQARRLQGRIKDVRIQKAKSLLDEARRLFDDEKKYAEVRDLLDQIQESYSDVSDLPSVEALKKAVDAKLGKSER